MATYPVRNAEIVFERKFGTGEATLTALVLRDVSGAARVRLAWYDGGRPDNAVRALAFRIAADAIERHGLDLFVGPAVILGAKPVGEVVVHALTISEPEPTFSGAAADTVCARLRETVEKFER